MVVVLTGPFAAFELHDATRIPLDIQAGPRSAAQSDAERLRFFDAHEVLDTLGPALHDAPQHALRSLLFELGAPLDVREPWERHRELARLVVSGAIVVLRIPHELLASDTVPLFEHDEAPLEPNPIDEGVGLWVEASYTELSLETIASYDDLVLETVARCHELTLETVARTPTVSLDTHARLRTAELAT